MQHFFDQGKVIIITGAEGSGKSSLAEALARSLGASLARITMLDFRVPARNVGWALTDTVIVEGFRPRRECDKARARALAVERTIVVKEEGMADREVPPPNFIFVSDGEDMLKLDQHDRRFMAIHIGPAEAPCGT